MNINQYLGKTRNMNEHFDMLDIRPAVVCADGFKVSIQASSGHYCRPRSNYGPYSHVELGYPSKGVHEWYDYAEDNTPLTSLQSFKQWFVTKVLRKRGYPSYYPTNTIYAFIPVELVEAELDRRGGIVYEE